MLVYTVYTSYMSCVHCVPSKVHCVPSVHIHRAHIHSNSCSCIFLFYVEGTHGVHTHTAQSIVGTWYLVPGTWYLCIYFQLLTIVQRPSKRIITVPGTLCFQLLTIVQRIITVVIFTGTTRLLRTLAQSIISLLI